MRLQNTIIAGVVLVSTACGLGSSQPAPDLPPWKMIKDARGVEVRALQKPPYTYFYGLNGDLRQINLDNDGDQKPEVLAYFSARNTPDRVDFDENHDGNIDRWEEYSPEGTLLRYQTSAKGGKPDRFVELDPSTKATTRIETDLDHDGRRERLEVFSNGKLIRAEIDSDGDGKRDRIQDWTGGYLVSEEIDRDADGKPDIRIVRSRAGAISRIERLPH